MCWNSSFGKDALITGVSLPADKCTHIEEIGSRSGTSGFVETLDQTWTYWKQHWELCPVLNHLPMQFPTLSYIDIYMLICYHGYHATSTDKCNSSLKITNF